MKNNLKIWLELHKFLTMQAMDRLTKYTFFKLVCEWLASNMKSFGQELWCLYKFETYINYEPLDYPMEYSEDTVRQTVVRINKLEPSSMDSIAMIVRDILWDMVAYKSDIECSNCGDDDLRTLYDEKLKQIVLSCDLCGWSQFENGKKWSGDQRLAPAKINQLEIYGYLK